MFCHQNYLYLYGRSLSYKMSIVQEKNRDLSGLGMSIYKESKGIIMVIWANLILSTRNNHGKLSKGQIGTVGKVLLKVLLIKDRQL